MIFTAGMKYLFSEEKLDITKLEQKDIKLMNDYLKYGTR